ncbi:dihydroxyacetone kinase subunit L [Georgenia yuyongxinii]|uniref:Dihydroxyacetone kinase subunit L n=1 Tax=Georgenia yuyongxinii TaxID=2589797 RepID=A0A5B8C446_9MICO|nr:dihydroxyacetone kinase subunit DhaL [Georgenia yuyongxinii]QDC24927.1 dihydroxyacetone kinase subunit L [Georgenia yuyongxinii]
MTAALQRTELVVRTIAETTVANEKYFGDLDSVVGDGDFGYSLARGFEKVLEQWDDLDRTDAGVFLQKVAMVISSRMGGTSGPIWGTAFLRAGAAAKGKQELGRSDVVEMLRAAITGIKARGGADLGEKTLLDALVPMTDTLADHLEQGGQAQVALDAAAVQARESAEATSELQARRGRASYTGERSIGSPDPGALAIAVLAEEIAKRWQDGSAPAAG